MAHGHQHGITNKALGEMLRAREPDPLVPGHLYYCATRDPVTGAILNSDDMASYADVLAMRDAARRAQEEFFYRNLNVRPWEWR